VFHLRKKKKGEKDLNNKELKKRGENKSEGARRQFGKGRKILVAPPLENEDWGEEKNHLHQKKQKGGGGKKGKRGGGSGKGKSRTKKKGGNRLFSTKKGQKGSNISR